MPTPRLRTGSRYYWLRKRVPDRYRPIVGHKEVWRSLETSNLKRATALCAAVSMELEDAWETQFRGPTPSALASAETFTNEEIWALAGEFYTEYHDANRHEPGTVLERSRALELHRRKERRLFPVANWKLFVYSREITDFLRSKGRRLDEESLRRFSGAYFKRRGDAEADLLRKAEGDYEDSGIAQKIPVIKKSIPARDAFDRYAAATGLKPRTVKRWKPVIDNLAEFLGHDDLARIKKTDLVRWKNKLLADKAGKEVLRVPRTVRDVYIAVVRAVFTYLVDEDELSKNPAETVVVRGVKVDKDDDKKGFTDEDAATILRAALEPQSGHMSVEMAAAHRWVPWICAYTGARVNEITSLRPQDFLVKDGFQCIHLRKEVTKTSKPRTLPLHTHLLEQDREGLMAYVDSRRKLGKPLFYDPGRARKEGERSKQQYEKVASKLGDWVRAMDVNHEIWPNHGWRHRWKAEARHAEMHPDIADFITGHGGGSVSKKYGPRWVKTFAKQIAKLPAYRITVKSASTLAA